MPRRVPVRPAVVVLAVWALALTGCSGNSEATAQPSPAPPESVTSYSPPSEPPPPVPVDAPDETRAAIFVLAWFETLNYGFATGDADPLRESTSIGCFTCANWIIEVQTQADRGAVRQAGSVHVRDLVFLGPVGADYQFRARLDRDPGVLVAADGTRTEIAAGSGEVVDLTVGVSSSALTDTSFWSMKAITSPAR